MRLAVKRLVAYWLDFVMLAGVLAGGQALLYLAAGGFPFDRFKAGYEIELWVLATMSLPVWCYFIGMEYKKGQTIGKRLLKLKAAERDGSRLTLRQAFVRTFVRLLPWELTHLIVLLPEPWWDADPAYPGLIYIPNGLMLIYIAVLAATGGRRTLHDAAAGSRVRDEDK
jgi:Predicted membrane protein/domain